MSQDITSLRNMLLRIAARYLWMAVPKALEDYLVTYVFNHTTEDSWNDNPEGILCVILTECTWAYHVGWLDLENPDPYSQMPEPSFEIPDFKVIGPHETWIKIAHQDHCDELGEKDDVFYDKADQEYQEYGYFYLR